MAGKLSLGKGCESDFLAMVFYTKAQLILSGITVSGPDEITLAKTGMCAAKITFESGEICFEVECSGGQFIEIKIFPSRNNGDEHNTKTCKTLSNAGTPSLENALRDIIPQVIEHSSLQIRRQ